MTKDNSDVQNIQESKGSSKVIAKSNQFSGDLQDLDEKVNPMIERSQNMIPVGKQAAQNFFFMIDLKEFSKNFAL